MAKIKKMYNIYSFEFRSRRSLMINIPAKITKPLSKDTLASLNNKISEPISKETVLSLNAKQRSRTLINTQGISEPATSYSTRLQNLLREQIGTISLG